MTLTVVSNGPTPSMPDLLDRLQREQFEHDETYHREISRLSVQDRLRHMALHFAKYAGQLWGSSLTESARSRTVTDVLIIATSVANILNLRLAERAYESETDVAVDFRLRLSVLAGEFANACEKLDHLEAYPYREAIATVCLKLWWAAYDELDVGTRLPEVILTRLLPIKKKSIFYSGRTVPE